MLLTYGKDNFKEYNGKSVRIINYDISKEKILESNKNMLNIAKTLPGKIGILKTFNIMDEKDLQAKVVIKQNDSIITAVLNKGNVVEILGAK